MRSLLEKISEFQLESIHLSGNMLNLLREEVSPFSAVIVPVCQVHNASF